MFKKVILLLLCFSLILGCCACTSSGDDTKESDKKADSESTLESESESETESETTEESETESKATDESSSADDSSDVTDNDTESESESESESKKETENLPDESFAVKLSSEKNYKIVYASDLPEAKVKRIATRLSVLDKKNDYVLTSDATAPDGSPEILVGITNRPESAKARADLKSYLDYSITVKDNKIIIVANTEERIEEAVQKFVSCIVKRDDSVYYEYTTDVFVDEYTDYSLPSLSIGGANIGEFSIVISDNATENDKNMATDLTTWIAENTGAILPVKLDSEPASATEIIIGSTNRTEFAKYTEEYRKTIYYAVETQGTKLLIITGIAENYLSAFSTFKAKATQLKGKIDYLEESKPVTTNSPKKAIFIGNSFIFWGNCVNYVYYKDVPAEQDLQTRLSGEDNGYFKQVCKANGIDMTVYNFTYGGKNLEWVYANRLDDLDSEFLADIDYVFISEAGENNSNIKQTIKKITDLFPNAEDVAYLVHEYTYSANLTTISSSLTALSNEGIKIVPWGKLVNDVHNGVTSVPGATLSYNKNSFIKNSTGAMPTHSAVMSLSGNGDSFHQNPLSGYITAQMCFSAITGVSAQGQKYDFCWDKTLGAQYDLDNFLECNYNNGQTSNFIEIFKSPSDMAGLQKLMDQYMAQYN